ncbi:MAG: 23S rRNA (pseudouridine(1915)-N(3))-methyltransferase RlmH [Deltaproteobacteria bacterium]|nr:23S rRNA (pseudouridine(1915)-N(3))-methyltransferase RlmH [Deltaproteobacteria bacterium]
MRTRILVMGDDKKDPLVQAAQDYLKRAGSVLDAEVIFHKAKKRGKGADDEKVRAEEGQILIKASAGCTLVCLDATGKKMSSEQLSQRLESLKMRGKNLAFVIGGATGLSDEIRGRADEMWSLSGLTFPHKMALLMLCEQLYRAGEISRGGPYHK